MPDLRNSYSNLPGVRTVTEFDFKKEVAANKNLTESVLIIGTARDGPSELYRLSSITTGLQQYGDLSDSKSPEERKHHLIKGILEASEAGCTDIWCLRVGGKNAELSPTYTGSYLILKALYPGEKYGDQYGTKGIGVIMTEDSILIRSLAGKVMGFKYQDGVSTFSELISVINSSSLDLRVRAEVRDSFDPNTVITSAKPAVITAALNERYNILPSQVLHFNSIDGDNHAGAGWDITFPGTRGTIVNTVATTNMFCIMRGVNDIISIASDTMVPGTWESVSVLNAGINVQFFTGAELATQLQAKLNADALLTDSGANSFTVTFTLGATPFSIAIDNGAEIALDYMNCTIAEVLGFGANPVAGDTLVSDTEVAYNVLTNANDRFVVNENNQYMRDCVVAPGNYTAATLLTAINDALLNSGSLVTCTHTAGLYTFTSSRYGSSSCASIAKGATSFLPMIGYDKATNETKGTGFAKFLDQSTAKEVADRITAYNIKLSALPIKTVSGVTFKIYSNVKSSDGSIVTGTNVASTLNETFGIPASTTYYGQDGNLPVILPGAMVPTWTYVYMSGGEDGMNPTNDEYMDLLAEAYNNLEDVNALNYIVPMGAYVFTDAFGNVNTKHAENLARVCAIRSSMGHYTHGVISIEPIVNNNLVSVNDRVATLREWNFDMVFMNDYYKTTTAPTVELQTVNGQLMPMSTRNNISILAGPEFSYGQPTVGIYIGTGEASYAGQVCALSLTSASTNKTVKGPIGLYYTYGTAALNDLVGARFVCFKKDSNDIIKTVLDVTYDEGGNTYDNLYTFRIMSSVITNEIKIAEPYIGEAISNQNINSLGSAIQKYLDNLKGTGVLRNFKFEIVAPQNGSRMAECYITQILDTAEELKRIFITTKLSNKF